MVLYLLKCHHCWPGLKPVDKTQNPHSLQSSTILPVSSSQASLQEDAAGSPTNHLSERDFLLKRWHLHCSACAPSKSVIASFVYPQNKGLTSLSPGTMPCEQMGRESWAARHPCLPVQGEY